MTIDIQPAPLAPRARRRNLTDRQVASLPRKGKRYVMADPEQRGLYLRVPPSGPITFSVAERNPYGTKVWAKIGTTADMDIATARERSRVTVRRIKDGLPAFEAPPKQPDTYKDVVEQFLELHVNKEGLRSRNEIERLLDRQVLPFWGKLNFVDIKRRDITALLDSIVRESGPWSADHTLAIIRKVSAWYATRDGDYVSPFVRGMKRTPSEARSRDRTLTEPELRKVWVAAEANGTFGALIHILLLTAQRRDKVVNMKRTDVDVNGLWTIPTEVREKGNGGILKLPPVALAIIQAQPRVGNNPYVFAATRGDGPLSGYNKRKAAFDEACGVTDWTLHDLRRTARSLMSAVGVSNEHAERVLGHKLAGVRAVYDRHEYLDEKSAALRKLAAEIKRIVTAAP
jgi:integrase